MVILVALLAFSLVGFAAALVLFGRAGAPDVVAYAASLENALKGAGWST
jgi:hypothetical protein